MKSEEWILRWSGGVIRYIRPGQGNYHLEVRLTPAGWVGATVGRCVVAYNWRPSGWERRPGHYRWEETGPYHTPQAAATQLRKVWK